MAPRYFYEVNKTIPLSSLSQKRCELEKLGARNRGEGGMVGKEADAIGFCAGGFWVRHFSRVVLCIALNGVVFEDLDALPIYHGYITLDGYCL